MGGWARGGDSPLASEWGLRGMTDEYLDGGRNVASIINGKLYVFDPARFDPSTVAGIEGLQMATPQEMQQATTPSNDGIFGAIDRLVPTTTAGAAALFGGLALGGLGLSGMETALARAGLAGVTGGNPVTSLIGSGIGAGTAATGVAAGGNGMSGVLNYFTGGDSLPAVDDWSGNWGGSGPVNYADMNGGGVLAPSLPTNYAPGPWATIPAYPDYTSQIVNGTMDYGQLGADLGASGFGGVPAAGMGLDTLSKIRQLIGGNGNGGGSNGGQLRGGGGLLGNVFNPDGSVNWGGVGSAVGSAAPGMAALAYANSQPGIDTSGLQSIIDNVGGVNTDSQESVLQRMGSADPAGGLQALLTRMQATDPSGQLQSVLSQALASNPGASLQDVLARMQASDPAADLRGVLARAGANTPGYIQAATDPVQRNIAAGYGDLKRSQALRGLGGSSFGDTSLANYMDQGNRTLANAGATAAREALGLEGTLAGQIGSLTNTSLANQAGVAGNIGQLDNQRTATLGGLAGNIGTLQNQNFSTQGSIAGQAGALQNTNLGQQGTLASSIYNSQLARLLGQGGLQQGLIGLRSQAQKNKNDMFGRAFSGFGRGFGGGGLGSGLDLSALGIGG